MNLAIDLSAEADALLTFLHAAFWLLVVLWSIAVILFVFHLIDGRRKDRMTAFERAVDERNRHFGGV